MVPVSFNVNQASPKTQLCRLQGPFSHLGVDFKRSVPHLSDFIVLENAKYQHVLGSALIGLDNFSFPIKANQKYTNNIFPLPELIQSPQGSLCSKVCTREWLLGSALV